MSEKYLKHLRLLKSAGMPAISEDDYNAQIAASEAADAAEHARRAAEKVAVRASRKHALAPRNVKPQTAPDGAENAQTRRAD